MLTLFSIPKPFSGEIGRIQRNALSSWVALEGVQVVLLGDEDGVGPAATAAGAEHIGSVLRSPGGTPRIDDAFARVDAIARFRHRCFVNADIVLLDDFLPSMRRIAEVGAAWLSVGETRNIAVEDELDFTDTAIRSSFAERLRAEGTTRGATAIDYFVFTADLFDPIPAFVVGRARFDNWLVWRARQRGPVIDATRAVLAGHQAHDYTHVAGGLEEAHFGEEARRNDLLAGGSRRAYTIHDASHKLRADGTIVRNFGAVLRLRERARIVSWKVAQRRWRTG